MNERIKAMTQRIEKLIKAANTTEPYALAAYLVSQGVCDAEEVEEIESEAFGIGYAVGED